MRRHPQFRAYVALACVCLFWGTTYVGIRMALETFPPLWLVAVRYLVSGSLMVGGALLFGAHVPRGRELALTSVNGIITLGLGNGCLAFAEQWIPSGLAALFITTSPFWMVGVEALVPGGERLHLPAVAGMLVGAAGVAFLVAPAGPGMAEYGGVLAGFLTLQLGCAGWAIGSIAQRRQDSAAHSFVSGAVQQLATGAVCLVIALAAPQGTIHWSARGIAALAYLVMFGSIIGYSAYLYALDRLPVAIASVYTYINPLVAVALGWLFYREPFGKRQALAMAIIFAGVAVVKRHSPPPRIED